ncbi:MAG: hypothetical protein AAF657_25955, partial [Acidobacteriota bacterium]
MAEAFGIRCSSCPAQYVLPEAYRQHLEGRAAYCPGCERWWVPLPATSGPAVRLVKGRPERAQVDLRSFRRPAPGAPAPAATAAAPTPPAAAPSPPAAPAPAPGYGATTRVPLPKADTQLNLRIALSVPGTEQARKGVFDLAGKSFLIGRQGCHVNLPKAQIPPRAVRIRAAEDGFRFEGIDGFMVPLGSLSIESGQIKRQGSVRLELDPYEVLLEASATPGRPINDLEPAAASAPASPAPPAPPAPAPAPPAASPYPPAPQAPVQPAGVPGVPAPSAPAPAAPNPLPQDLGIPQQPQYLQGGGPSAATDLRQQVQDFAIDVRQDQQSFSEQHNAVQEALDGDMTITDLGAQGFQANRFGNPLDGLEVSLVRADGPAQGQAFRVTKSPLMIGRREG